MNKHQQPFCRSRKVPQSKPFKSKLTFKYTDIDVNTGENILVVGAVILVVLLGFGGYII